MKIARTILLSALLFASASAANAGATDINSRVYRPIEGLSYNFGSKLAVGYFLQKDGTCALNLFLAENTGDDTGPSAARLQFKVAPGRASKLIRLKGRPLKSNAETEAQLLR